MLRPGRASISYNDSGSAATSGGVVAGGGCCSGGCEEPPGAPVEPHRMACSGGVIGGTRVLS